MLGAGVDGVSFGFLADLRARARLAGDAEYAVVRAGQRKPIMTMRCVATREQSFPNERTCVRRGRWVL